MPDDLKSKLESLMGDETARRVTQAMEDLDDVRKAVQETLLQGSSAVVSLQPGYRTNDGQQIRFNVRAGQTDHVLFRAFVPARGYPIKLDFYNEELTSVRTKEELDEQILNFLQDEDTQTTLLTIRRYAA